ncbi:winged helix family two component transcriptional regulator [Niallia circulans]|uniref:Transcriptional regulator n=1 Tax=Niallia circulans TaxID=1397 RepID=A0A0J1HZ15_NIACI|nr:response regulator transcription factor [Niallia circulans]KLV18903.1 transcriptional regulator [Niallia circulans]MCM2981721.1 response regulator transcription factor [Niallia circulans]MDR4316971.1 response regulator transcription factor [Niallia circulans]MED3837949.1 response regulator transcription factor [Niallia circulans]MED4241720.1 response regulator transcription factor [Niallia circulans]
MKKILIVEDELAISMVLGAYLENAGYDVDYAYNGEEALQKLEEETPALILLDIMMPYVDGWSVLSFIRKKSACPVIMLTALSDTEQKLKGFENGADDYITKPFVGEEVIARVQAVLRRSSHYQEDERVKYYGDLKINYVSHQVFLNGIEVPFTPRDLSVFLFLASNPNQTFTRDQLLDHVWGNDYDGSDRAVDLAIKRIRKLLNGWDPKDGEIKTLRGLGYQFYIQEKQ